MRILITGGAGFIGSHLAERLLGQGHEVTVWDNFSSGKEENLTHIKGWGTRHGNPAIYRTDCRKPFPPMILVKRGEIKLPDRIWPGKVIEVDSPQDIQFIPPTFDFIYHLASTVGVKRVLEDPKEAMENNIDSLRAVLGLGIPGLFTSTSEVYGKTEGPLSEDSPLLYSSRSRWSYAASKLVGEWMALQAGWKVVRLFNVVGPRQSSDYGAVLPNFVKQALAGEPLTVYGSGEQVRTFIDVRDCVDILDRLREKTFDVVNVGGTHVRSMLGLGESVSQALRLPLARKRDKYSAAYPAGFEECPERVPDLTKLDSLLPERPCTDFSKTIRDLAEAIKPTLEVTQNA